MCNELDSNALNCIVKIFMMFYSIFYNKGTNSSLYLKLMKFRILKEVILNFLDFLQMKIRRQTISTPRGKNTFYFLHGTLLWSFINDFKLTLPERIGVTIFEKYLRALKKL